jgi:hypothetical protein
VLLIRRHGEETGEEVGESPDERGAEEDPRDHLAHHARLPDSSEQRAEEAPGQDDRSDSDHELAEEALLAVLRPEHAGGDEQPDPQDEQSDDQQDVPRTERVEAVRARDADGLHRPLS